MAKMRLIIACLIAGTLARADTIHLTNGRSIDGIITQETKDGILLDLGVGSMKIRKSRIKSIDVSDAAERDAIEQDWKKKNILHRRHVPKGLEDLANQFKKLDASRAAAIASTRAADAARNSQTKLTTELTALQKKFLQINQSLQFMEPAKDPAAYNAAVAANNSLSAELKLKEQELADTRKALKSASEVLASYMHALSSFEENFRTAAEDKDVANQGREYTIFFEEIEKRMKGMRGEYHSHSIVTFSDNGATLVPVIINGKSAATLILDTGASIVSISKELAKKLDIDLTNSPISNVTLANGQTVSAWNVVLDSISAGSAKAEGVPAVVLPTKPGDNVDGLLGMSFLGRFRIQMDAKKKLVLEELEIKEK